MDSDAGTLGQGSGILPGYFLPNSWVTSMAEGVAGSAAGIRLDGDAAGALTPERGGGLPLAATAADPLLLSPPLWPPPVPLTPVSSHLMYCLHFVIDIVTTLPHP